MQNFKAEAQAIHDQLILWRRWCHQRPGIGFEVQETAAYIAQHLREWGLDVETGVGRTGVVGVLRGAKPGPVIGVRVDIDALPIQEENTHDFVSLYPGKMHACGHDAHTAMGLGVARLLSRHQQELAGTVVIIFQPAEEGLGGARTMIADGVLSRHKIQAMVGGHIGLLSQEITAGQVGISYGPIMAAAYNFDAEILGKGGHGAYPHETIDPVVVAAEVISAWQRIITRELSPLTPAVISVGKLQAGQSATVIPEAAELSGTIRFFDDKIGDLLFQRVEEVLAGICKTWKAEHKFKLQPGYPPLINDKEFTRFFADVAVGVVGEKNVKVLEQPSAGGEDMAFFLREVPGTYYFLGAANPDKGIVHPHHHPQFDIDEDVLPLGVALLAQTAWEYTQNNQKKF